MTGAASNPPDAARRGPCPPEAQDGIIATVQLMDLLHLSIQGLREVGPMPDDLDSLDAGLFAARCRLVEAARVLGLEKLGENVK